MVTFTAIIGNADGHGENLSLLSPTPGVPMLAPLYDTVPTVLWPKLRSSAAMSVAGLTDFDRIDLDAVGREAEVWASGERARSGWRPRPRRVRFRPPTAWATHGLASW